MTKAASDSEMSILQRVERYIRFHNWILSAALALAILIAWEAAVDIFKIQPFVLPKPTEVFVSIFTNSSSLIPATIATSGTILAGFALSIVLGLPIAVLLLWSPLVERAFFPLLLGAQLVPKVALAPLLLVWLGIGRPTEITVAFLLSFFPITVNAMIGIKAVETGKINVAKSMGAKPLGIFAKVTLPSALPTIFAGMKVASTLAVVGAIVGEFVGAREGLGNMLLTANSNFDTALMFAAIACLTIVGMLLFFGIELVEHFAIPWHVSKRSTGSGAGAK